MDISNSIRTKFAGKILLYVTVASVGYLFLWLLITPFIPEENITLSLFPPKLYALRGILGIFSILAGMVIICIYNEWQKCL